MANLVLMPRDSFLKRVSVLVDSLVNYSIVAAKVFGNLSQRASDATKRNLICVVRWCGNGGLYIGTLRDSGVKHLVADAKPLCYLFKSACKTERRNNHVGSGVVALLFNGGPSAVVWIVVTIYINSVKRVTRWRLAHV